MKTIIFDFDGTLTKKNNEIWRNIWKKLNALDVDDILYTKFNNGEISYSQWCEEIEKEFIKRRLNTITLDELICSIELMENLSSTLEALKKEGYELCILSGGINYVITSLLKENINYFKEIRCNNFYFDKNGYLIKIEDTDSDGQGKARYIMNYINKTNSKPHEIIFIGNGHNDRFVSQTGCHTLCLNPNGTNHEDKNIWHHYINGTENLYDIVKIISNIYSTNTSK